MRWGGLGALIEREIYRFLTVFTQTVMPPVISSFLFIFIFGFALGRSIQSMGGFPYMVFLVPGLIALYLIESTYTNASSSLFLSRWSFYIQELLVTPLSYIDIVIAIMTGSLVRGVFVGTGVYLISLFFAPVPIAHPWLLFYLLLAVTVIFSSIGIVTALLAEEFEHLALMTNFVITPLAYFGGVFTSLGSSPPLLQGLTRFNPFFYVVDAVRFSMLGISDAGIVFDLTLITPLAALCMAAAVWLFRIGFKIRS
jgi:ABC-2 type transport system permease protein